MTRWLKSIGDSVELDEPLVEVSTEKVDTEIGSPFEGVLESILIREDQTAQVGGVLATIAASGAEQPGPPVAPPVPAQAPAGVPPAPAAAVPGAAPATEGQDLTGRYYTPLVRKLARQHGIDLAGLQGTGLGGRVQGRDVRAAAGQGQRATEGTAPQTPVVAAAPAAPKAQAASSHGSVRGTQVRAPRIRSVIAARMRESLDTATQLTQVHEVDVTALVRLRARLKDGFAPAHGVKLTYLPFIALAVAQALKVHPMLNASFNEAAGTITYHDSEHLAFAVDAPKGLLVPVVRDAGTLDLVGLARGIADVAARTRNGSITADELGGGTFSITNIGSVGALFDTPILNMPQVGILGVGAIVKRPMAVTGPDGDEVLAIRHMMYLSLSYDHRLVDGADAGRFLQTVRGILESAAFETGMPAP